MNRSIRNSFLLVCLAAVVVTVMGTVMLSFWLNVRAGSPWDGKTLLLPMSIATGLALAMAAGFSVLFSARLSRIITANLHWLRQAAAGEVHNVLPEKPTGRLPVELNRLSQASTEFASYVRNLHTVTDQYARGEFTQTIIPRSDRDALGLALQRLAAYMQQSSRATTAIAEGELRQKGQTENERDRLGTALNEIELYLRDLTVFIRNCARGEIIQTIAPRSERDLFGVVFHRMAEYLREMTVIATAIAQGDVRQEIQPKSDRDLLGTAFYKLRFLRELMNQMMSGSEQVREASEHLMQISTQMAADADRVTGQVVSVSPISQQINDFVTGISTAVEEFSASIHDITHHIYEAADIVTTAVQIANSAQTAIAELNAQSREIGNMSQVITAITQQTNLLALNATIEASRAGEAGRGFIVIAHEVKELAQEIASLAQNITQKITTIQAHTQKAVTDIGAAAQIIAQVHDFSGAIATAVAEQSTTTDEIARRLVNAADGTAQVQHSIADVATAAHNVSSGAATVREAAQNLHRLADQLQQLTLPETREGLEHLAAYYQQANLDWKAFKGVHLTIGLNMHPFSLSLRPLLPIFEKLTGMQVTYMILPEEEYFEKLLKDLSSGSGTFDVYMTAPMFEWRYQYAGWIEDLNPYYQNPKLTDQAWYRRDDFFEKVLRANMWDGTLGGGLGKGRWNGIPVMVEFYNQAFREDLRQKWGLPIPKTYPEFRDVAMRAAEFGRREASRVYGVAERGIQSWSTVHSGYLTAFASYGQSDLRADLTAAINTPAGVDITQMWVDMLQKAGDPGWASYTWYDAKQNFAAGKFYAITDADYQAASYENPTQSRIVGKVGYALPPAGPDGRIKSNMWTWALGLSAFSKQKEAAWLFLLWATAPRTMLDAALKWDNFNPTRKSVWDDPGVVEKTLKWGTTPGEYRAIFDALCTKYGDVAWSPNPDVTTLGEFWAAALREAYQGQDVQTALNAAAEKINELMAQWRKS